MIAQAFPGKPQLLQGNLFNLQTICQHSGKINSITVLGEPWVIAQEKMNSRKNNEKIQDNRC